MDYYEWLIAVFQFCLMAGLIALTFLVVAYILRAVAYVLSSRFGFDSGRR